MLWPIEFLRLAMDIPTDDTPLPARIFAVADDYDAVTSDRACAPAKSRKDARDFIAAHSGTDFDPKVVEALLALEASIEEPSPG